MQPYAVQENSMLMTLMVCHRKLAAFGWADLARRYRNAYTTDIHGVVPFWWNLKIAKCVSC